MRYFSNSYIEARTRLRSTIEQHGSWHAYPIEHDPQLTIDVARIGAKDAKKLRTVQNSRYKLQ